MLEFFTFEVRMRLRSPAMWIFFALFGLLGFGAMASDAVRIGGGAGQTAINAPYVIAQMLTIMAVLSVILVTAFTAGAVVRDFEDDAYQLFFTKPIRARDYLLGRFAGGTLAATFSLGGTAIGMMIGTLMPWIDAERLVAFSITPYVHTMLVFVLPDLLVMGAFFFTLATLTRRMLWSYVGVVGFFVLYVLSQSFIGDFDNELLAALSDPFGMGAANLETRYWTAAERNTRYMSLTGALGLNRALWLSAAAAVLAFAVRRFRLQAPTTAARGKTAAENEPSHRDVAIPVVHRSFGAATQLRQFWMQLRVELRGVISSGAYIVLALFSVVSVYGQAQGTTNLLFGTPVYPVTQLMLRVVNEGMALFMLIVITFYAGELVWKERKVGLSEVADATPAPNWVPMLAKIGALWGAVATLLGAGLLTTVAIQLLGGYTRIEPALYAKGLFGVELFDWAWLCVMAVAFQVLANHKYLGFGLMIVFFVAQAVLPLFELEHRLYRPTSAPSGPYSDMNGYGHFVAPIGWLRLYWSFVGVGLLLFSNLLWVRGTDPRLRLRLREARRRVTRLHVAWLAVALAGIAGAGGWVYYNANVLNEYTPGDTQQDQQEQYERLYKQYEDLPQPQLVASDLEVDIYPETRKLDVRGRFTLRNKNEVPVETLHVRLDTETTINALSLDDEALREHDDAKLGYRIYRLAQPLAPGAELVVRFDFTFVERGFPNSGSNTDVVENGTFFHNGRYVPHFGYDPGFEIGSPNERRDRDLPERPRMAEIDDARAHMDTYLSRESAWIDFKATVSTSADQIALAPGYLVKEWTEGDRRYFRYEMDAPILDLYAFLSARYVVARDQWRDVEIAVYYHEPHDYNVERMIDSVKKSLEYYSENFSPYQHRQLRIVEFPRYASYAQSLPNIVPYSESVGFIADLRDTDDVDSVFYVTAHEVAHQWWAHQVIGANVQGSTLMSETLSQYSALMVMEAEYSTAGMKKFLRHELDQYLQGRATEIHRELPLMLVENQPYVHYNKGSLVMYSLRQYIGAEAVNQALAQYIRDVGFQEPPYTDSREFVAAIRAVTPAQYAYLIEDLFETITLYDTRVTKATARELDGGRYEVTLAVTAVKLRADEKGAESQIPINDWIQVGAFGEDDEELAVEMMHFDAEDSEVTFIVDALPARAGIDPRVLLIDRNPDDNVRKVELAK